MALASRGSKPLDRAHISFQTQPQREVEHHLGVVLSELKRFLSSEAFFLASISSEIASFCPVSGPKHVQKPGISSRQGDPLFVHQAISPLQEMPQADTARKARVDRVGRAVVRISRLLPSPQSVFLTEPSDLTLFSGVRMKTSHM